MGYTDKHVDMIKMVLIGVMHTLIMIYAAYIQHLFYYC